MFNRSDDAPKKQSFFSRITGSTLGDDEFFQEGHHTHDDDSMHATPRSLPAPDEGGELAVDVYQTQDAIVVKAFIAGVQPGSLDISLSREMLTVTGTRTDEREVEEDDYYQRELFWGSFSRTILLPEEVDVDMAEASEKHGILMIRLPKINKKKQTKLKVKSR